MSKKTTKLTSNFKVLMVLSCHLKNNLNSDTLLTSKCRKIHFVSQLSRNRRMQTLKSKQEIYCRK